MSMDFASKLWVERCAVMLIQHSLGMMASFGRYRMARASMTIDRCCRGRREET